MYYVNNKFAHHGKFLAERCETMAEANEQAEQFAYLIMDFFNLKQSSGEWIKTSTGRKYTPPENGYLRVGDAAYWEWHDRVLSDVDENGILTDEKLFAHCLDAVKIYEDEEN